MKSPGVSDTPVGVVGVMISDEAGLSRLSGESGSS